MSDRPADSGNSPVLTPYASISAQDLINVHGSKKYGVLRKRGKRERMLENLKFAKSFLSRLLRWRQRFVVISQGCVYCFNSEYGRRPIRAFSLFGYNRLRLQESEQSPWTFRIESPHARAKMHFFACVTDEDRKVWMRALREEMAFANGTKYKTRPLNEKDEYVFLETPIFEDPVYQERKVKGAESDSDGDEDNTDYDEIDEEEMTKLRQKPNIPLPAVPGKPAKVSTLPTPTISQSRDDATNRKIPARQSEKPKPKVAFKLSTESNVNLKKKKARRPSEEEYFLPGNNREKALSILKEKKTPGTYLVRLSRNNDAKVLAVMTDDDVKEYKIYTKDKNVTLDNKTYFKSVEDLLVNYEKNELPNRPLKLDRAYSVTDLRV